MAGIEGSFSIVDIVYFCLAYDTPVGEQYGGGSRLGWDDVCMYGMQCQHVMPA